MIYEWGAIFSAFGAVGFLALWSASLASTVFDFHLEFGSESRLSLSNGELTACNVLESWDQIDWEHNERALAWHPRAISYGGQRLPGARFWYLRYPSYFVWIGSVSLWLSGLLCSLLAAFFAVRYRKARRIENAISKLPTTPIPSTCSRRAQRLKYRYALMRLLAALKSLTCDSPH